MLRCLRIDSALLKIKVLIIQTDEQAHY